MKSDSSSLLFEIAHLKLKIRMVESEYEEAVRKNEASELLESLQSKMVRLRGELNKKNEKFLYPEQINNE